MWNARRVLTAAGGVVPGHSSGRAARAAAQGAELQDADPGIHGAGSGTCVGGLGDGEKIGGGTQEGTGAKREACSSVRRGDPVAVVVVVAVAFSFSIFFLFFIFPTCVRAFTLHSHRHCVVVSTPSSFFSTVGSHGHASSRSVSHVQVLEDPQAPLYGWGSRWTYSVDNMTTFVEKTGSVLFLGRSYEGSFWVRGVELANGLQMWCGLRAEYMTFDEFDAKGAKRPGGYAYVVFTKFYEFKFSLLRARGAAKYLIYDTVDNFWGVPLCADAVLVNTRAQRTFYEYMNITIPIFVLPHHTGNHNDMYVRSPRPVRSHVLVDPRVPRATIKDLQHRAHLRHSNVTFGTMDYDMHVEYKPSTAYARSMYFSLQTAAFDLVLRWMGYTHVDFCFKPGHRLANSLSMGVPTITDASEGFLEILDDAGILDSYPLVAEEHTQASRMADRVLTSLPAWRRAATLAQAAVEPNSLRTISWRLFDIFYALHQGNADKLANSLVKPILMEYCRPENVLHHYGAAGITFELYDELPDRTKMRKRVI